MSSEPSGAERAPGLLLVLSAPSGAGKTTLAHRFRETHPDAVFSVSATTRPPRGAERDGIDYHFVSPARFAELVEAGAFAEVQARLGLPGGVTLADVISAEGVVRLDERPVDVEIVGEALRRGLGAALSQLMAMRGREGEALARDLVSRLDELERLVARVAELAPQSVEQYRTRLSERIAELSRGLPVDPARLAQEVAVFADRTDVAEEITRLRSHVAQVRALLAVSEPAGRKLDFLVQEMHREANTIGSKSQSADIAGVVVALKAEIERMREQVQNVE